MDEPRGEKFCAAEAWNVEYLKKFYGRWALDDIKLGSLMKYREWRVTQISKGTGARTVQIDWVTLSNVLNFAVRAGIANINYVAHRRPRLRADNPRGASQAEKIAHCRDFAPVDGNELNLLAHYFFADRKSEAIGFQMLFEAFTSCRSNEALRLRTDAANTDQPGFIQGNHLFIARSKHGVFPFVLITPELADFLECWRTWHDQHHAGNPWWFPGRCGTILKPLGVHSLNHALRRASKDLGLPKRSGHGLRSFFATRCRGEGQTEAEIAAKMGITSIALLEQVYGGRPPNWDGMRKIRYWPDGAAPAWHKWKPGATTELDFSIGERIVQMR
jgi:integrase